MPADGEDAAFRDAAELDLIEELGQILDVVEPRPAAIRLQVLQHDVEREAAARLLADLPLPVNLHADVDRVLRLGRHHPGDAADPAERLPLTQPAHLAGLPHAVVLLEDATLAGDLLQERAGVGVGVLFKVVGVVVEVVARVELAADDGRIDVGR